MYGILVRSCVWRPPQIKYYNENKMKMMMIVYAKSNANEMTDKYILKGILESLAWITYSHQVYRSTIVFRIKFTHLVSCTVERRKLFRNNIGVILAYKITKFIVSFFSKIHIKKKKKMRLFVKRNTYWK